MEYRRLKSIQLPAILHQFSCDTDQYRVKQIDLPFSVVPGLTPSHDLQILLMLL